MFVSCTLSVALHVYKKTPQGSFKVSLCSLQCIFDYIQRKGELSQVLILFVFSASFHGCRRHLLAIYGTRGDWVHWICCSSDFQETTLMTANENRNKYVYISQNYLWNPSHHPKIKSIIWFEVRCLIRHRKIYAVQKSF